jgi:hypothetical protein
MLDILKQRQADYNADEEQQTARAFFGELCRRKSRWFPTHSAEKRGMDGARGSTVNPKML